MEEKQGEGDCMDYEGSYAYTVNDVINKIETSLKGYQSENAELLHDVHELINVTKELSFRDAQLNVYNLNYFFKVSDEMIAAGKIGRYVACHFNMKRFSVINHLVGREMGSMLLNRFVVGLQENLGEDGCVCRINGDSFTILFLKERLSVVTEYLFGRVMETNSRGIERVMLEAHAGFYVIPETCKSSVEIMDRIGTALNVAKYVKKAPHAFFDEEVMKNSEHVKWVEGLFWDAVEKEEFEVYYQPKVMLNDYHLVGAEALCRWKHDGEMIQPGQFIPVLEQSHLICALDFYMLGHVCRDISRWLKEGKPVVKVSVNLSRIHLGDADLLETILEIIDHHEVPHEYIEIELTETTTEVDFKELKQVVIGLRMQGVSVAVDDFGVGYSSLNLIREMPWKSLKIDRSFLPVGKENDEEDEQKKVMLKYIIGMAQSLGLECIAEGVETMEQVALLKENRCYLAQGFLFDRPIPVSEFEERLMRLAV